MILPCSRYIRSARPMDDDAPMTIVSISSDRGDCGEQDRTRAQQAMLARLPDIQHRHEVLKRCFVGVSPRRADVPLARTSLGDLANQARWPSRRHDVGSPCLDGAKVCAYRPSAWGAC